MTVKQYETYSISGFGGGYEDACQRMLWRGVAYLETASPPVEMWQKAEVNPQIFGIFSTRGDDLKALEAEVMRGEDDVTGAMHHAVMRHLWYIHTNGLDKWREELSKNRPDGPMTWAGDVE